MKKFLTLIFTLAVACALTVPVFAQDTGSTEAPKTETGKKKTKTSKAHKGGKKSKKGSGEGTTTPPPK